MNPRTLDLLQTADWRSENYTLALGVSVRIADDLGTRRMLIVTLLTANAQISVTPFPIATSAFIGGVVYDKPITINDWQYGPVVCGPWYVTANAACTINVIDIQNL